MSSWKKSNFNIDWANSFSVTSIEAFDHSGELMAMFFGERKPGQPEREDWRAIVRKVSPLKAEAA